MTWHDDVDLDGKGEPVVASAPIQPVATVEDATGFSDDDDQFIDETALRAIVSDIVKSELQGELGERITRNVRKLVHREIMRALASRELD